MKRGAAGCLMIVRDPAPGFVGKRCALSCSATSVGRSAECDVVLEGDTVSPRHALFEQHDGAWHVTDCGSATGTYRNDEPIDHEVALSHGDRVSVGSTIFKLLSGPDVDVQYSLELSRLCFEDGLTQIPNARALDEAIAREIRTSRWNAGAFAVLILDIDGFTRLNQASGSLAGDFVLRGLTRLVRAHLRSSDIVGRYGEDELAILLPGTSRDAAALLGERLRRRVSDHRFAYRSESIAVTISAGVAELREGERAGTDLVERAAEQLARAKREGRDRVCG